jgi:sporulation protein YlmC with PRC-barrel domain
MLKQLLVATAIATCGATAAFAQTTPADPTTRTPPPARSTTSPSTTLPATGPSTASAPAKESTGDFNASGQMAGSALIGAKIHNATNETVGSVGDIYLDDGGNVKAVVVSVGGVLGVGARDVAVKWEDLKFGKDGKSLLVTTSLTKDALKAMPDYKDERQKPAAGKGG